MPLSTTQRTDCESSSLARPSPRIIALAIAVVRSKPLELSIGEYIRFLREHVARGRRQDAVSATYRYLDRSSYWRSRFEQTDDALKKTQEESITLRLEIETLKSKLGPARPSAAANKRKKPDEDVIPYPRAPKRPDRGLSTAKIRLAASTASSESLALVEFSNAGEVGNILLRSLYQLNAMLRRRDKGESSDLAYHIALAASKIAQIVNQEVRKFTAEDTSDLVSLEHTLTAAGRGVKFVFSGFTKLASISASDVVQGKVIYDVVRMFKAFVDGIAQLSASQVDNAIATEVALGSAKKASTSKSKTKSKALKSALVQESAVLGIYTAFLTRLIEMIDSKAEANKPLFEGMAYCIINKVGQRLYCTVFGHDRGADMSTEILRTNQDGGVADDSASPTPSPSNIEIRQAKLEAPYLVHLLKHIMTAAPSHLGLSVNVKTGKPKKPSAKGAAKGALAIAAKECLQKTLINSIFGTEGVDEEDPFIDYLTMPVVGTDLFAMPKIKETDAQEWFKEEVWRLLGWDILEREIARSSCG